MSDVVEPPKPQRGTTAAERRPDISPEQAKLQASTTWAQRLVRALDPRFLLSMAQGYPAGIKQFLQLCLILIYPAWLFFVLCSWPVWVVCKAGEGVLYLLFWPVRANERKNHPERYAAWQAEQAAKKAAGR